MLEAAALRKNEAYTHEYLGTIAELGGDEAGRRATWEAMWQGSAFYHGLPVALSYVPRMFGPETRRYFADIAETTYGILSKVITQYLVPVAEFPNADRLPIGEQITLRSPYGLMQVKVLKIEDGMIHFDHNHELAGQALTFEIELVSAG